MSSSSFTSPPHGEARVHRLLAQRTQALLGEVVDGRLEGQQTAVVLLPPLASGHHDRRVGSSSITRPFESRSSAATLTRLPSTCSSRWETLRSTAGRQRLDRPHPSEVVAEPHAQPEPGEVALPHARRRSSSRPRGRPRRSARGSRECPAFGASRPAQPHASVAPDGSRTMTSTTERPPGQPAGARSADGISRRVSPSGSETARSTDAMGRAVRTSGAELHDDIAGTAGGEDKGQTRLGRRHEFADAQLSLSARCPQHGSREEGVLILPIIPVRPRLHGVDGRRDEAVAHGRERDDTARARTSASPLPASRRPRRPRRLSPHSGRSARRASQTGSAKGRARW
jgi:hypothetical protein